MAGGKAFMLFPTRGHSGRRGVRNPETTKTVAVSLPGDC